MNTSETGGYLREPESVMNHKALEDAIHAMLTGITGIEAALVRPAFQGEPLAEPPIDVDWCGFYLRDASAVNYPYVGYAPDGDGSGVTDIVDKEIHLYFYGPHSEEFAGMVRRGLHVEQNHREFRKSGIVVKRVGNVIQVPEIVHGKWLSRSDLIIYATVAFFAEYPVFQLEELADGNQSWNVIPSDGDSDDDGGGGNNNGDNESAGESVTWDEKRPKSGTFLNINR